VVVVVVVVVAEVVVAATAAAGALVSLVAVVTFFPVAPRPDFGSWAPLTVLPEHTQTHHSR
jgi:hypothetical protein